MTRQELSALALLITEGSGLPFVQEERDGRSGLAMPASHMLELVNQAAQASIWRFVAIILAGATIFESLLIFTLTVAS